MKLIEKDVLTASEMDRLADEEVKKGNLIVRTTSHTCASSITQGTDTMIWTQVDGEKNKIFYERGWHLVNRTGQWFVLLKETEVF